MNCLFYHRMRRLSACYWYDWIDSGFLRLKGKKCWSRIVERQCVDCGKLLPLREITYQKPKKLWDENEFIRH